MSHPLPGRYAQSSTEDEKDEAQKPKGKAKAKGKAKTTQKRLKREDADPNHEPIRGGEDDDDEDDDGHEGLSSCEDLLDLGVGAKPGAKRKAKATPKAGGKAPAKRPAKKDSLGVSYFRPVNSIQDDLPFAYMIEGGGSEAAQDLEPPLNQQLVYHFLVPALVRAPKSLPPVPLWGGSNGMSVSWQGHSGDLHAQGRGE